MKYQGGWFKQGESERMFAAGAAISDDELYRYRLWRIGDDDLAPVLFLMLNPSTADGEVDDPTIRRCIGFARGWGSGGILVANLFAYRTKSPEVLAKAAASGVDIVGPEADEALREMLRVADLVVCGWGKGPAPLRVPMAERVTAVMDMIRGTSTEVCALGVNGDGSPKHPLYLRADAPRLAFPSR